MTITYKEIILSARMLRTWQDNIAMCELTVVTSDA